MRRLRRRWEWIEHKAHVLCNVLLLVLFTLLDVRDLYFKLVSVGHVDTFSFTAVGFTAIEDTPLVPLWINDTTASVTAGDTSTARASGWGAFLSTCETINGAPGFFLHAIGTNCTVGPATASELIPELVLVGTMRVDSLVWNSCALLFPHRRPPLCQSPMVATYLQRYGLLFPHIPSDVIAPEQSPAEQELLALLNVVGVSAPLARVTCVEAFPNNGPGVYGSTLFGCASPNVMASAFVGLHVPFIGELQRPLGWLTVDRVNLLGIDMALRQNVRCEFTVHSNTASGTSWAITSVTYTNFSSFGVLYGCMVIVDVVLQALHARSSLEVLELLLLPLVWSRDEHAMADFARHHYTSIFSRALYRSRPVVVLTVISQLLAWQYVLANAFIWAWSVVAADKAQAFLTSLRFWVLLLVAFNLQWECIVRLHEPSAFLFAHETFLTTTELVIVGAVVTYLEQDQLFALGSRKYARDGQRVADVTSFADHIAFANGYDGALDDYGVRGTSFDVLQALYLPLESIIGHSILALYGLLFIKLAWRHVRTRCSPRQAPRSSVDLGLPYSRLPIERALDTPIRAASLLRNTRDIETIVNGVVYVRAANCFDFGLIVRHGRLCTRRGFFHRQLVHDDVLDRPSKDVRSPSSSTAKSLLASLSGKQAVTPAKAGPTIESIQASFQVPVNHESEQLQ